MRKRLKAALLLATGLLLAVHAVAGVAGAADDSKNLTVTFTVRPMITLSLNQATVALGDVFPGDNIEDGALTTTVFSNTLWTLSTTGPANFTATGGTAIPVGRLSTKQTTEGPGDWKTFTTTGTNLITDGPRGANQQNTWDFKLFLDWDDGTLGTEYSADITYTATNQ